MKLLTSLAVLVLLGAASQARAQEPVFEHNFEHLCLGAHGDAARTLAAADAAGWTPADVSGAEFKSSLESLKPTEVQARKSVIDGAVVIVMTGKGVIPVSGGTRVGLNFCAVAQRGVSGSQARSEMHDALGFAPVRADEASDLYGFTEGDGKRSPFTSAQEQEGQTAAEAGRLSIVLAMGDATSGVLIYGVTTGVAK
jgi:hypothetical protein